MHRVLLILQALTIPAPRGYVSDFAGVLDSASIQKMTAVILDVQAKAQGEIAVVTLPDLQGRDGADVAREIGRAWGVGAKGNPGDPNRNRGIVILLVPLKDHRPHTGFFRIETGMGSEGFVTDAKAGRIRDAVIPALSREDYGAAMVDVTERVAQAFADEFNFTLDPSNRPRRTLRGPDLPVNPGVAMTFLVLAMVIGVAILARLARGGRGSLLSWLVLAAMQSNRRNRWGGWGGGGGGGFGGFGGFGGGGGGGFGGFGGGGGFSGGGAGGSF